jgi:hypothetical protein
MDSINPFYIDKAVDIIISSDVAILEAIFDKYKFREMLFLSTFIRKSANLDLIKHLVEVIRLNIDRCALCCACEKGNLDVIAYIADALKADTLKVDFDIEDAVDLALGKVSKNGNLEVLVYLVEKFNLTKNNLRHALTNAYKYNHVPMVSYLFEKWNFSIYDLGCGDMINYLSKCI